MSEWMAELVVLLDAEFHEMPVVATLATVDQSGQPRARMVVIRHLDKKRESLLVATDARSAKVEQLALNANVEMVIWATRQRQQFRLTGTIETLRDGNERLELWNGLSESSRAMFYWSTPGMPRQQGEEFVTKPPEKGPPVSFLGLRMQPMEVESLELNEHPHRRRQWKKTASGWRMELLNP